MGEQQYSKEFLETEIKLLKKALKEKQILLNALVKKDSSDKRLTDGYTPEMIKFYDHKIPSNKTVKYFCDSFISENSKFMHNFAEKSFDLTRHKTYDWYELLFDDDYFAFQFEDETIGRDLSDELVKTTSGFSEKDTETFNELKRVYYSLTTSKFIYDW